MRMARRRATKARSKPAPAAARPEESDSAGRKGTPGNGALRQRLTALERECDALKAELERFKTHQRQLEETQAQVRDRLSWALDSLHNILDGKG